MSKDYVVGHCEVTLNSPSGTINLVQSKQAYKCPVCEGNGLVPNGFYNQTDGQWSSTSITPEICKSCKGTGVVWG